jgi:hypothetical protein
LTQQLPFNALRVIWEPAQLIHLGVMYALLAVPFTAGATCIGLTFLAAPQSLHRVYLWNLIGSGAGAIGIVAALWLFAPIQCLFLVAGVGLLAGLTFAVGQRSSVGIVVVSAALAFGAAALVAVPDEWTRLQPSEYKALSTALRTKDARLVRQYSGPLGLVSVVESPTVPFRYAPGLSLNAPSLPPEQIGVFVDGGSFATINRFDQEQESDSHLSYTTDALVYALTDRPSVLVLGTGGGATSYRRCIMVGDEGLASCPQR